MTKFTREMPFPIFTEEGRLTEEDATVVHLGEGAHLEVRDTANKLQRIRLNCSWWFTRPVLERLIAELIFLKEEWDNHPLVLEQDQEADMEEFEDEVDEDLEIDPPDELNPFRYRMDAIIRDVEAAAERDRRR